MNGGVYEPPRKYHAKMRTFIQKYYPILNFVPQSRGIRWSEYRNKQIPPEKIKDYLGYQINWGIIAGGDSVWQNSNEPKGRLLCFDIDWYNNQEVMVMIANKDIEYEYLMHAICTAFCKKIYTKDPLDYIDKLFVIRTKSGGIQLLFLMQDELDNGDTELRVDAHEALKLSVEINGSFYDIEMEVKGDKGSLIHCPYSENVFSPNQKKKTTGLESSSYIPQDRYSADIPELSLYLLKNVLPGASKTDILPELFEERADAQTDIQQKTLRRKKNNEFYSSAKRVDIKIAMENVLEFIKQLEGKHRGLLENVDNDTIDDAIKTIRSYNINERNHCVFQMLAPDMFPLKNGELDKSAADITPPGDEQYSNMFQCWGSHCRKYSSHNEEGIPSKNRCLDIFSFTWFILYNGDNIDGNFITAGNADNRRKSMNILLSSILYGGDGRNILSYYTTEQKEKKERIDYNDIYNTFKEDVLGEYGKLDVASLVNNLWEFIRNNWEGHIIKARDSRGEHTAHLYLYNHIDNMFYLNAKNKDNTAIKSKLKEITDALYQDIFVKIDDNCKDDKEKRNLKRLLDKELIYIEKTSTETEIINRVFSTMYQDLFNKKDTGKISETNYDKLNVRDRNHVVVDYDKNILGVFNIETQEYITKDKCEDIIRNKGIVNGTGEYAFIYQWWDGDYKSPEKVVKAKPKDEAHEDIIKFYNSFGGDLFILWMVNFLFFRQKHIPLLTGVSSTGKTAIMETLASLPFFIDAYDGDAKFVTRQDPTGMTDAHSLLGKRLYRGHVFIDEAQHAYDEKKIRQMLFTKAGSDTISYNEKFESEKVVKRRGNIILVCNDAPQFISTKSSAGTTTRFGMHWFVGGEVNEGMKSGLIKALIPNIAINDEKWSYLTREIYHNVIDYMYKKILLKKSNKKYDMPFGRLEGYEFDERIDRIKDSKEAVGWMTAKFLIAAGWVINDKERMNEMKEYMHDYIKFNDFIAQTKEWASMNKSKRIFPDTLPDFFFTPEYKKYFEGKHEEKVVRNIDDIPLP